MLPLVVNVPRGVASWEYLHRGLNSEAYYIFSTTTLTQNYRNSEYPLHQNFSYWIIGVLTGHTVGGVAQW